MNLFHILGNERRATEKISVWIAKKESVLSLSMISSFREMIF